MPEEISLVTYLPKPADDLLPLKNRVMNTLARGLMHFSLKIPTPLTFTPTHIDQPQLLQPRHTHIHTHRQPSTHTHIDGDLLGHLPCRLRFTLAHSDVYVAVYGVRRGAAVELTVKIYSCMLREMTSVTVSRPAEVCRIAVLVKSQTREMREMALYFLLKHTKSELGSQFGLFKRCYGEVGGKQVARSEDIRDMFWRKDSHRDIQLSMDKATFTATLRDPSHGKLIATCDLFYTFRTRDCYLHVSLASASRRSLMLKLLLNREDIAAHLHEDILSIVYERVLMADLIQRFVDSIGFLRCGLYTKAVVRYKASDTGAIKDCFMNMYKHAMANKYCLRRIKSQREVVCQVVKRFRHLYAVVTVRRHLHCEEYDIEMYFPQTQKRFCFEIFSEELLRLDKNIIQRVYELPSAELLYIIDNTGYCYQKVRAAIFKQLV